MYKKVIILLTALVLALSIISCNTNVIPVTSVSLSTNTASLVAGNTEQLTVTVEPENATVKNVTWQSEDNTIAFVDSQGTILGIQTGNTVITVTTVEGGLTDTCEVTVTSDAIPVTGVSLNKDSTEMTAGSTEQLTAAIEPADATESDVIWESGDESVVTVSVNGLVTAVGEGTADITATTVDGGFSDACGVTVASDIIPVTGVSLNAGAMRIGPGKTKRLIAAVEPADATNKQVTWESDNTNVAFMDSDGLVLGITEGEATVTVTTDDGSFSETCDVTVEIWNIVQSGTTDTVDSEITYTNNVEEFFFRLKSCPGGTFPMGLDNEDDGTADPFWIGDTEVTNQLVTLVYQWAYDDGLLQSGTVNQQEVSLYGEVLLDLANNSQISFIEAEENFETDPGYENYPCINISWYGAILFCNWLTEILYGESELVYGGMGPGWEDDDTEQDTSKTGFRLATENEQQCAGRYIGPVNPGYGIERGGLYWTPGTYASGAAADYNNVPETGKVSWHSENSHIDPHSDFIEIEPEVWIGTHPVGTAGNSDGEGEPYSGNANQLGVYDMSGNVWEWLFTGGGEHRYFSSGCFIFDTRGQQIGGWGSVSPDYFAEYLGFRIVRDP